MSQNKYNYKFNPPKLTSEEINQHKDFDAVMAQFEAATPTPQPARVMRLRTVRRNISYVATIGAAAMLALVAYFTIGTGSMNNVEKEVSKRLLAQPYVNPQFEKLQQDYTSFSVEGTQGGVLEYESGSKVIVPANAFVDKNGQAVSGEVEIRFKEYHDFIDFFLAGIPMKYDSAGAHQLVSAGMIDVQAFQNGEPVALKENKTLDIELVSTINYDPNVNYNIYKLDEEQRNWVYQGVDLIEPILDGDLQEQLDAILRESAGFSDGHDGGGDTTTISVEQQINMLKAEQSRALATIENTIPKPEKPYQPEPANPENFAVDFDFDNSDNDPRMTELAEKYQGLLWEVSKDQEANYNIAANPSAQWSDVKWNKVGNTLEYEITLINAIEGGKNLKLRVKPVLTGQDYQDALNEFNTKMAAYEEAIQLREDKLKMQKEALARRMEEELAALEAQQKDYEARLAQYRQKGYKRLITEEMTHQKIVNKFQITSLGIWNCDRPIPQGLAAIDGKFQADNQPLKYLNAYLVNKKRNTVAHFLTTGNQAYKMYFFNDTENLMWVVDGDGKLKVVYPTQFKEINEETKDFTFDFTSIDQPIDSEEDLRAILKF